MKKLFARALMLGLVLALPTAAQAQVDQGYYQQNAAWWSNTVIGTKFQPTKGNIRGAGIYLYNVTNLAQTANLHIGVWGDDAGGNQQLANVFVNFTLGANQGGWISGYWTPQPVVNGVNNYIQFQTDDAVPTSCDYNVANSVCGAFQFFYDYHPTSAGNIFFTDDGTWTGNSQDDPSDLVFEEYYNRGAQTDITAAPEPASLALLATGLVGVAGIVRRRRRV